MQYFKHYTKLRHDVKIKRLITKYGLEGYGLYVLILESIAEEISTEKPLPILEETCEDLSEFYNGNSARIDEITRFMVSQGLFEVDEVTKRVSCYKIYKYLEQSQTRSEKIRQLIESYKDTTQKMIPLNTSQTVSDKSDRIRLRTEQNKKIDKTSTEYKKPFGSYVNIKLTDDEYSKLKETIRDLDDLIETMSCYCQANGKKYKDYAAALRQWAAKDGRKIVQAKPSYRTCPKCSGIVNNFGFCKECNYELPI